MFQSSRVDLYASEVSQSVDLLQSTCVVERKQGADRLRKAYVGIFEEQVKEHSDEPHWWKEPFVKSSEELLKSKCKVPQDEFGSHHQVALDLNGRLYKFSSRDRVVLVGRMPGCHLQAGMATASSPEDPAISRLHAVVYYVPELLSVYVVDVGSLFGIRTVERSSELGREHSSPNNRRVLVFRWNEHATLELGSNLYTLQLSPPRVNPTGKRSALAEVHAPRKRVTFQQFSFKRPGSH